ncbi:MAG: outer membrane protein [Pseudomonadota bacterium]|jgi:opacity protein-like surface antigen
MVTIKNGFPRAVYTGLLVGLLSVFGTTQRASADNTDYQGPYARLIGGLNFALDSDFDGSSSAAFPSGDASLDTGALVGLAGGYRFNRNFAADLEYVYRSNDIDKIEGSAGATIADGGDLASVAIMASGYYYLDVADNWSPYFGLGLGFLQEIDSDLELVGINDQKDLEDQVFAWQVMAGAEIPVDEHWRFYGEGRFMSAPSVDLSNGNGSYSVDYNNLSLIVGIGYQF